MAQTKVINRSFKEEDGKLVISESDPIFAEVISYSTAKHKKTEHAGSYKTSNVEDCMVADPFLNHRPPNCFSPRQRVQ